MQGDDALNRVVRPYETPVRQFRRLDTEIRTATAQRNAQRVGLKAKALGEAVGGQTDFHDVL